MKYTQSQKRFWALTFVSVLVFIFLWFLFFSKTYEIKLGLLVFTQCSWLAVMQYFWIGIARRGDFKSGRITNRPYPTEVDKWNSVQEGIPWITMLLGFIPIFLGFLLSLRV